MTSRYNLDRFFDILTDSPELGITLHNRIPQENETETFLRFKAGLMPDASGIIRDPKKIREMQKKSITN